MTKRTLYFTGLRQVELVEEPLPAPGPGELLVETTRTLISTGTEGIAFARNFAPGTHWDQWVRYPFRVGYCHAGRIIGLGEGVADRKIGERVASRGSHSSHVVVGSSDAVPIPDGVADEDAAWMGLGKITQLGVRAAEHALGDCVVVVGLGLLGQLVVQYTRLLGAREVIAVDTAPRRLEMAAAHGATRLFEGTAEQVGQSIEDLTGGKLADVVYDVTGHPAVFAAVLPLARTFGTVVLLGDTGQPHLQTLSPDVVTRGLRIVGAHDSNAPWQPSLRHPWSAGAIQELFLLFLARGQMRVGDLITHRYAPEQAAEAYGMLERERQSAMGVIFEWA